MSYKKRLAALRARANTATARMPTFEEAPTPHEPQYGLPVTPIVIEEYTPLAPPKEIKSGFVTCGGCGDWLKDERGCPRCTPSEVTPNTTHFLSAEGAHVLRGR